MLSTGIGAFCSGSATCNDWYVGGPNAEDEVEIYDVGQGTGDEHVECLELHDSVFERMRVYGVNQTDYNVDGFIFEDSSNITVKKSILYGFNRTGGDGENCFDVKYGSSYITLEDSYLYDTDNEGLVHIQYGASNTTVQGCFLTDAPTAIYIRGAEGYDTRYVYIYNNVFWDISGNSIRSVGSSSPSTAVVGNIYIYHNSFVDFATNPSSSTFGAIYLAWVAYEAKIINNHFYNRSNSANERFVYWDGSSYQQGTQQYNHAYDPQGTPQTYWNGSYYDWTSATVGTGNTVTNTNMDDYAGDDFRFTQKYTTSIQDLTGTVSDGLSEASDYTTIGEIKRVPRDMSSLGPWAVQKELILIY